MAFGSNLSEEAIRYYFNVIIIFNVYRSMHQTLKKSYGVHVPRDSIMQILKKIDLSGTEERK